MQAYIYKARDENGKVVVGTLEAESKKDLRFKLRQGGYYVSEITRERDLRRIEYWKQLLQPVTLSDLLFFCQQFRFMFGAGLSMMVCLDAIWKQTENVKFQIIISKIKNDLLAGSSLSKAVSKYPDIFPKIFVSLVNVGESGGILDEIFKKLVIYFQKEQDLRNKVKLAFFYPLLVLIIAIVVVGFMVVVIVPTFSSIFSRMGVKLPLPTLILMNLSIIIRKFWWALLIGLAVLGIVLNRFKKSETGSHFIDRLKLKLPVLGDLNYRVAVSRFVYAFGILIDSGFPLVQSLKITSEVTGNSVIGKAIASTENDILAGNNISQPLEETKMFPPIVTQMIAAGEESGTLDRMLSEVSEYMDQEIDYKVKRLTTALEPLLTVCLGVIVGFIALAMYLPVFNMVKVVH